MNFRKLTLWIMVLFLVSGCAQTVAFRASPDVSAASGEAKVSKDNNGNSLVKIEIAYLAPPANLSPAKSVYVVWAQAPQGRTVNLGQMLVGNNRVGKFTGITSLNQFRIMVTPEDLPAVATPSKQEILSTEVFTVN